MKRLFRFRLRAIFALFAVLAVCLIFGPKLYHRHYVNRAVAEVLESGPDLEWRFGDPFLSAKSDELFLLLSDLDRVLARLFDVLKSDAESLEHRKRAVATMDLLLSKSGTAELRAKWLHELIRIITADQQAPAAKEEILEAIGNWIPGTGITRDERNKLFTAARRGPLTPAWVNVLIAIGGRRETLYVLEQGGTHDMNLLAAIHNTVLIRSRWRGLLPFLKNWLADPIVADSGVLEYAILVNTIDGRKMLLDYVLDPDQPLTLRQQAITNLEGNVAGINLILDAATDPATAVKLDRVVGGSVTAAAAASRKSLDKDFVDSFWPRLVDDLSPNHWFQNQSGSARPKQIETQLRVSRQRLADINLAALQRLAGRDDLTTISEWQNWLTNAQPKPPTVAEVLNAVIDTPDLLSSAEVLRRILPGYLGEIPPECLPLYKQLLKRGNPQQQFWASYALLTMSDDLEAVPVVIDLIGLSKPTEVGSGGSGEVALLHERFAENYFWDVDAWKKWWEAYNANSDGKDKLSH